MITTARIALLVTLCLALWAAVIGAAWGVWQLALVIWS